MTGQMSGSWRKLVGVALLWVAIAVVVRLVQDGGGPWFPGLALAGLGCFGAGLLLFADGLERSILANQTVTARK